MTELLHRIKVFVYRMVDSPDYLLLRADHGIESFWGPVQGNVGFGEKLETAIRREVMRKTGLVQPLDLIDLEMPSRWLVGDEQVIEWTFGFHAVPADDDVEIAASVADFEWAAFSTAYPKLELDNDRAAIMRLHTMLSAA
jgi:ADP-ribose pyrophosphatase YjhB (NUDIX family)